MATHSSIFAWRIPWVEEPGGLQSTGSQRLSDFTLTLMIGLRVIELLKRMQLILSGFFFLAILHRITFGNFYIAFIRICLQCRRFRFYLRVGKIPWRRKWQPTLVFLPGEYHGHRSLVGYSPLGHKIGHD